MGDMSFLSKLKIYFIDPWLCFFVGHSFKFEPMEGDVPPFEFEFCTRCGKNNPRTNWNEISL